MVGWIDRFLVEINNDQLKMVQSYCYVVVRNKFDFKSVLYDFVDYFLNCTDFL